MKEKGFNKDDILRILLKLNVRYVNEVNDGYTKGLCWLMKKYFIEDFKIFTRYFLTTLPSDHIFYDFKGKVSKSRSKFAWKIGDSNQRLLWLEKHINLNSK